MEGSYSITDKWMDGWMDRLSEEGVGEEVRVTLQLTGGLRTGDVCHWDVLQVRAVKITW